MGSSSTILQVIGEELPEAFCKLLYLRFCFSSVQWKHSVVHILPTIWETFFFNLRIIVYYNSYKLTCKFSFVALLSFCKNLKQKYFKVCSLVTKNSYVFVYSESRSISKLCWIQKKYKGILLHVAPVRIIFSWCNTACETLSFIKVTT